MPSIYYKGQLFGGAPLNGDNTYTKQETDAKIDQKANGEGITFSIDSTTGSLAIEYDDGQ